MNKIARLCPVLVWLHLMWCPASADTNVMPVIAATKGKVTVSSGGTPAASAALQQAVPMGSEITTGKKSEALVSLVPGITARIKGDSTARVKTAQTGATERLAEVELVQGKVLCRITKEGAQTQKFRLGMGPQETAEAVGTMWQSGVSATKHHVAVLEGTVTWGCLPAIKEISVPAGSVLLADYESQGGANVLVAVRVVNLLDGTVTIYYLDGRPPETVPASADQLKEARDVFSEAVGDETENLKTDERAALLSLLFDANRTLALAGVTGIGAPGVGTTAVTSTNPADATSSITP